MAGEVVKKNDFIELEFVAKVKDGEIFDTNIKAEAEKIDLKIEEKPFIICIGHNMVIKGLDQALENKEINKDYEVEISPENAFGSRKTELVKTVPLKVFTEQKINPQKGMTLALDNAIARIIAVSGGRVITDFNNPLAGKVLIYKFKIKRKIKNENEKINALMDYFLKTKLEFAIKDKKIIIKAEKPFEALINVYKEKFKGILGKDIVFEEKRDKDEKKTENKKKTENQVENKGN